VALSLGGALMLAAALRSDADLRAARLGTLRQRAFTTAESALWNAATATTAPVIRALPIGGFTRMQVDSAEFSTSVTLVRVDSSFAWIVSAATVKRGNDIAQHRLGMSLRISTDSTDHVAHEIPDRGWTELF
jgi:hypothetical protein